MVHLAAGRVAAAEEVSLAGVVAAVVASSTAAEGVVELLVA